MAITLSQQPQLYHPVYNPILFQGVSGSYAVSDFYYKVTITDIFSSNSAVYRINPRPDGRFIFDASPFAQNYVQNTNPQKTINAGTYVITHPINDVRYFSVLLQEYYGGVLYAGTTYNFYAWNGSLSAEDFIEYNYLDYIYRNTAPVSQSTLTDDLVEKAYTGRSNYWYYLSINSIYIYSTYTISVYNSSDVLISTTFFADTSAIFADYRYRYICIDFGLKGLNSLTAGQVTGAFPIFPSGAAYYTIFGDRFDSGGTRVVDFLKKYIITCEPKFTIYSIHSLFDNGHFKSVHFSKVSEKTITANRTPYKQIPYENVSNVWKYDRGSASEKILTVEENKLIKLRTDWLTEEECDLYSQLVTSPISYLDDGGSSYLQVIPVQSSHKINKDFNGLFQLELDYKYTLTSYKQRG